MAGKEITSCFIQSFLVVQLSASLQPAYPTVSESFADGVTYLRKYLVSLSVPWSYSVFILPSRGSVSHFISCSILLTPQNARLPLPLAQVRTSGMDLLSSSTVHLVYSSVSLSHLLLNLQRSKIQTRVNLYNLLSSQVAKMQAAKR